MITYCLSTIVSPFVYTAQILSPKTPKKNIDTLKQLLKVIDRQNDPHHETIRAIIKEYLCNPSLTYLMAVTVMHHFDHLSLDNLGSIYTDQKGIVCYTASERGDIIRRWKFSRPGPPRSYKIANLPDNERNITAINPQDNHVISVSSTRGLATLYRLTKNRIIQISQHILHQTYTIAVGINSQSTCAAICQQDINTYVTTVYILNFSKNQMIHTIEFERCNISRVWLHPKSFSIFLKKFANYTHGSTIHEHPTLFERAALFQEPLAETPHLRSTVTIPTDTEITAISASGTCACIMQGNATIITTLGRPGVRQLYPSNSEAVHYQCTQKIPIRAIDITDNGKFITYCYGSSIVHRMYTDIAASIRRISLKQLYYLSCLQVIQEQVPQNKMTLQNPQNKITLMEKAFQRASKPHLPPVIQQAVRSQITVTNAGYVA